MGLIVQKFGGSSVADAACIRRVAARVLQTQRRGHKVVVIVSAMGDTTDDLIALAQQITATPSDREMDMLMSTGEQVSVAMLAMALHALGADAVSLTGPQAGIFTDGMHRKAKIRGINPRRIWKHLKAGQIVIVAGFQGQTPKRDIATLGRGGSDTTAVALAAALKADRCQIFTDVEGVYSADPRIVKRARKLDEIAYDEMLELASLGAKVLMARSVEFAKKYGVELEVLSSFSKAPGTIVKEEVKSMEDIIVRGVSADKDQAKITLGGVPDRPGVAARLFK
ncbi:MAG: aspartate kinase, partial [Lentisphaerae bacterium]|nr:aspartate kinase [Lentisphaerota bacterium]